VGPPKAHFKFVHQRGGLGREVHVHVVRVYVSGGFEGAQCSGISLAPLSQGATASCAT